MLITDLLSNIRIELQDRDSDLWQDDELVRAVEKAVSHMSRLLPKRNVVETTLVRTIASETLTISSSTGTLAYKPVKVDSLTITGKTLDTDYTVDYLTGIVTEIGSLLPDTDYTAAYELDPYMLDISSLLSDYIKIERVEYPAGGSPPTHVTSDVFGEFLVFRGDTSLTDDEHLRIVYLGKWTAPDLDTDGDYPSHLNNVIIIGSSGQALIFKAEKYTQLSASTIDNIIETLNSLDNLILITPDITVPTAPSLSIPSAPSAPTLATMTPPTAPTLSTLTPPTSPTLSTLTPPTSPTLSTLTPPSAPSLTDITAPTAPSLDELTPPTAYTFVKPTSPSIPEAPSAPSEASISFTDAETAIDAVDTEITAAKAQLEAGDDLINVATRGDRVGETFGVYAAVNMSAAGHRVNESLARLRQLEDTLAKYASEVTSYGSDVNAYANNISGLIGIFREEVNTEMGGVNDYQADINKYQAEISEQVLAINLFVSEVNNYQAEINEESMKIGKYSAEIQGYQAEVAEDNLLLGKYSGEIQSYQMEIYEDKNLLDKYIADIQKYQAEVSEDNLLLGKFSEEIRNYLAEIQEDSNLIAKYQREVESFQVEMTGESLAVALYEGEVRGYQAEIAEYQTEVAKYNANVNAIISHATQAGNQVVNYLNVAGRFLASGQSKINEMAIMLGTKPEFPVQKASSEQWT